MTMRLVRLALAVAAIACATIFSGPAAADPLTDTSNGAVYTIGTTQVQGSTPGGGKWDVQIFQLSGGNPAVTDAFNQASRASADYLIDQSGRREHNDGPPWQQDGHSELTFRPAAIAQQLTGVFFAQGAAHPLNFVSTVVIDSRTAKPITLSDLFVDEQAGLDKLSQWTKAHLDVASGRSGADPVAANFVNWIPTPNGLQITFNDYQFVHGTPAVVVPWSEIRGLLAPDMVALVP